MAEFQAWPKIPRLSKPVIITEKIDGTNACVIIERAESYIHPDDPDNEGTRLVAQPPAGAKQVWANDAFYNVTAQSRTRIITPEADNFGFAAWTYMNAEALVELLGEGRHFGEWWGAGIQRRYGRLTKTFSLFNTKRWGFMNDPEWQSPTAYGNITVVPLLGIGTFQDVPLIVESLRESGSVAAPGFMKPEGVVAMHTGSGAVYKAFCENDDVPKGEQQGG